MEAPPPEDDDIRRREEEELQRVLEMSRTDTGGRGRWVPTTRDDFSGPSSSGASSSKAPSISNTPAAKPGPSRQASVSQRPIVNNNLSEASVSRSTSTSTYPSGGYPSATRPTASPVANRTATPPAQSFPSRRTSTETTTPLARPPTTTRPTQPVPASSKPVEPAPARKVTLSSRVRALHTFEPTEAGELGFEKGDVIKVIDRLYKEWWKGQLRGKMGIFPVNYVVSVSVILRILVDEWLIFCGGRNRSLSRLQRKSHVRRSKRRSYFPRLQRSISCLKLIDRYSQKRGERYLDLPSHTLICLLPSIRS